MGLAGWLLLHLGMDGWTWGWWSGCRIIYYKSNSTRSNINGYMTLDHADWRFQEKEWSEIRWWRWAEAQKPLLFFFAFLPFTSSKAEYVREENAGQSCYFSCRQPITHFRYGFLKRTPRKWCIYWPKTFISSYTGCLINKFSWKLVFLNST